MQERRIRERVPFMLEIEICRSSGWVHIECSRDLSMGGVQICLEEPLMVGETVSLRFHVDGVPEIQNVEVKASVARVEKDNESYAIGLKFQELPSDLSLFLFRLIQYHKN